MIDAAVVSPLPPGATIVTTGALPRLTTTLAGAPAPNALEHPTVIVLAPTFRAIALVVVLEVGVSFTVQLVPAGIEEAPPTVKAALVLLAVVFVLSAGDAIAIAGTAPRLTLTTAATPGPNAFVHATTIAFAPLARLTELTPVLVELAPLTVQVVPAGIELPPPTV